MQILDGDDERRLLTLPQEELQEYRQGPCGERMWAQGGEPIGASPHVQEVQQIRCVLCGEHARLQEYLVHLRYLGGWKAGMNNRTVTIQTDDPKQPKIEVPVQASVSTS